MFPGNTQSHKKPCSSLDPSSVCLPGCEWHVPFSALLCRDIKQFLAGEQKAMKLPLKDEIWLNAFYVSSGFGIGDAIVPAFSTAGKSRHN